MTSSYLDTNMNFRKNLLKIICLRWLRLPRACRIVLILLPGTSAILSVIWQRTLRYSGRLWSASATPTLRSCTDLWQSVWNLSTWNELPSATDVIATAAVLCRIKAHTVMHSCIFLANLSSLLSYLLLILLHTQLCSYLFNVQRLCVCLLSHLVGMLFLFFFFIIYIGGIIRMLMMFFINMSCVHF